MTRILHVTSALPALLSTPTAAPMPSTPRTATGGVPVAVRRSTAAEHAEAVAGRSVSFLQLPAWAQVKRGWRPEFLAWVDCDGAVLGTALVLHRDLPLPAGARGGRRSLAYVPEGPDLPWDQVAVDPRPWLRLLAAHLRADGAFAVRIGPRVAVRRWDAATVKEGLRDPRFRRFDDLEGAVAEPVGASLVEALAVQGWSRPGGGNAFGSGQPRFCMEIPVAGRDDGALLAAMNTQWRRAVRAGESAGVACREGTRDDLAAFTTLYRETAARDGFTPRPHSYFRDLWDALGPEVGGPLRLHLAEAPCEDGDPAPGGASSPAPGGASSPAPGCASGALDVLAASLTIDVGERRWYVYGASSARRRRVQASTALQWHMLRGTRAVGAGVYDLRGIADTVDEGHPQAGLLRFKLGTGAQVVEYAGEWELVLRRPTALAVWLGQAMQGRSRRLRRGRGVRLVHGVRRALEGVLGGAK